MKFFCYYFFQQQSDYSLQTLTKTLLGELARSLGSVSAKRAEAFVHLLIPERRVFCDAAGRSRMQASGFAMRLAQMGFETRLVGEPTATAFRKGDVLLVLSASGTTDVYLRWDRRKSQWKGTSCLRFSRGKRFNQRFPKSARSLGGTVLVITTDPASPLAQLADEKIILDASSKEDSEGWSIQPMGSLFEQSVLLLLDILVLQLMNRYGITAGNMRDHHANLE